MDSGPVVTSTILVHGAGSGPWVFDGWEQDLTETTPIAIDLQEGLDVASASMHDYADVVIERARALDGPVALCGWSMGGLVAMMAVPAVRPSRLVLLEPSPPAEVQGRDPGAALVPGTFDPAEAYGVFPAGMRARPESALARAERKRGISVPTLPCPTLVVHGDEFPEERGRALAALYGSELAYFPGRDHWDLVRDATVRRRVGAYLSGRG